MATITPKMPPKRKLVILTGKPIRGFLKVGTEKSGLRVMIKTVKTTVTATRIAASAIRLVDQPITLPPKFETP